MSESDYHFSTRTATEQTHGDDGGETLDDLREQVERLTEKVADLAEDTEGVDPPGANAANRRGPTEDADLEYVASASAMRRLDERSDGRSTVHRMPDETGGEAANAADDADTGYVEAAGALNQLDDE